MPVTARVLEEIGARVRLAVQIRGLNTVLGSVLAEEAGREGQHHHVRKKTHV
jgi:hypothetical protein